MSDILKILELTAASYERGGHHLASKSMRYALAEIARLRMKLDPSCVAERQQYAGYAGEEEPPTIGPARPTPAVAAALAEARTEGRRQGLEEAAKWHDQWQVRNRDMGSQSRARLHGRYATAIRSLATAPAETQKPETGESKP